MPPCLCAFLLLCLFPLPAPAADLEARVTRVGLFGGSMPIIRPGVWSFVEVALRTKSEKHFDGQLRIDQLDRDGDVMTSVVPVALAPQAEWRPYQVYFVPYDQNDANALKVKLFDADGRQVALQNESGVEVQALETAKNISEMRSDDFLIVDLTSPKRLPHIALLDSDRIGKTNYVNGRKARTMLPRDLPSRAQGLEAVDAIVWDDADPTGLTEQQTGALIEWTRAGGRLLITSGKNWQSLSNSSLATVLPVTITGLSETTESPEFLALIESLSESESFIEKLTRQYDNDPIRRCKLRPNEGAIPIPADSDHPAIAYRGLVGRGTITFVGGSLMQLLPPTKRVLKLESSDESDGKDAAKEDEFTSIACEKVIARRLLALPKVIEDQAQQVAWRRAGFIGKRDLFEEVRRSIGFEGVGTAFLLFAILFAIAYTLVATTGSFWYMKRRGWQHHAWSAFAAVAIAGTTVGTGMVWLLRGFSTRLWQTTIIDAHANSDEARATALFGIKTPDHTRLNLRLPVGVQSSATVDQGPLRPVSKSESMDLPDSRFVASERYESSLAGTAMENVPLRATLKEFLGTWHGSLPGKLDAALVAKRNLGADTDRIRYEFADGSYLNNNLGVALRDCLLIAMPPLQESTEEVAGERDLVTYHYYWLGDIAKSGDASQLSTDELRRRLYTEPTTDAGKAPERVKKLQLISDVMNDWEKSMTWLGGTDDPAAPQRRPTTTPQQENAPLLILSTFNLIRSSGSEGLRFMRTYGRALDCTHQLTKRTAILIGWSDEPSPVVLEKNLTALRPERARTLYRFIIPVERK